MNRKTKMLILLIVIVSVLIVVMCLFSGKKKSSDSTEESMPGYSQITDLPGTSFFVNSKFTDSATAITEISNDVELQSNQYYSYKNGKDKYILFDMNGIVVAAQKGTKFGLDKASDKEKALTSASLMNIWFSDGTKKLDSVTSGNTTITKVAAGVVINDALYGDFAGELVNITNGKEEWSLFVGVPGEQYSDLSNNSKKGIEAIASTFKFSNTSALLDQDVYAVSVKGTNEKKKVNTTVSEVKASDKGLSLSKQDTTEKKDTQKAYSSTPYNMLSVGDNGILSAFNDTTIAYEEPIINISAIHKGQDAIDIIKRFCKTTGDYKYTDAPAGSAWEVAEYALDYHNCKAQDYVNVCLCGMDGGQLKYRGIKYEERTYDMPFEAKQNGDWIQHYYVYYAIPNGCTEYCLKAGESVSVTKDKAQAAYFKIKE